MRIGLVGAGAVGGWAGARLALAGHELSVFARGATLENIRKHGLRLDDGHGEQIARVRRASSEAASLGKQDLVILAVKGPALETVAPAVNAMSGPETLVLTMMNGVPWWFFADQGQSRNIAAVDPTGSISSAIPTSQVIGSVVHASCITPEPGRILRKMGNGLILGEPVGDTSRRLQRLADAMTAAGFDVTCSERIQYDIWYKLWGNMTMNPVSAITGATCDLILDDELVRGFILQVMSEAAETGRRIGCTITESGEDRNNITRRLGAFKTSMLQDVEAGRPLELDALLAAPREIAQSVGVATPGMDALLGLARLFARTRGLYHA